MLFRACYEHEADAFHTNMAAGAAARRQEEQVRKDNKRGSSSRSVWRVVAWRRRADGPDLGRQKIKEIAFLDLKTRNFFWPAGAGQRGP